MVVSSLDLHSLTPIRNYLVLINIEQHFRKYSIKEYSQDILEEHYWDYYNFQQILLIHYFIHKETMSIIISIQVYLNW